MNWTHAFVGLGLWGLGTGDVSDMTGIDLVLLVRHTLSFQYTPSRRLTAQLQLESTVFEVGRARNVSDVTNSLRAHALYIKKYAAVAT